MNLLCAKTQSRVRRRASQRGLATVALITMLGIMVTLVVANTGTLRHLKREVQLVEQKQLKKFGPVPAPATSAPAAATNSVTLPP